MNLEQMMNEFFLLHGREVKFKEESDNVLEGMLQNLELISEIRRFDFPQIVKDSENQEAKLLIKDYFALMKNVINQRNSFLNCLNIKNIITLNDDLRCSLNKQFIKPSDTVFDNLNSKNVYKDFMDQVYEAFIFYCFSSYCDAYRFKVWREEVATCKNTNKYYIELVKSSYSHAVIVDEIRVWFSRDESLKPSMRIEHKIYCEFVHRGTDENYFVSEDLKSMVFRYSYTKSPYTIINNYDNKLEIGKAEIGEVPFDIHEDKYRNIIRFNKDFNLDNFKKNLGQKGQGSFQELLNFEGNIDKYMYQMINHSEYSDILRNVTNFFLYEIQLKNNCIDNHGDFSKLYLERNYTNIVRNLRGERLNHVVDMFENLRMGSLNSDMFYNAHKHHSSIVNFIYNWFLCFNSGYPPSSNKFIHCDNIKNIEHLL